MTGRYSGHLKRPIEIGPKVVAASTRTPTATAALIPSLSVVSPDQTEAERIRAEGERFYGDEFAVVERVVLAAAVSRGFTVRGDADLYATIALAVLRRLGTPVAEDR